MCPKWGSPWIELTAQPLVKAPQTATAVLKTATAVTGEESSPLLPPMPPYLSLAFS